MKTYNKFMHVGDISKNFVFLAIPSDKNKYSTISQSILLENSLPSEKQRNFSLKISLLDHI